VFYYKDGWFIPVVLTLLGFMGVWRHRSNIKRLMSGTENRFEFSKKEAKKHEQT
jgi:glycerol-3-phosphate acyltransferase PlsY